ncbi:hypothetical protein SteCoe_24785 [Stentor coeruleus]|uniref:Uncharacterized protein n=1 Tax=Stentor coeruleus TaxID=5963 RepID=A0A1R2BGR9_9CILI|nr:hypothetical protein SteCoe_24785 [Stentor coeruleus]
MVAWLLLLFFYAQAFPIVRPKPPSTLEVLLDFASNYLFGSILICIILTWSICCLIYEIYKRMFLDSTLEITIKSQYFGQKASKI